MDGHGKLRKIGITPRPLQDPHPPIYAPFSYSMESARFWAGEGTKMVSLVTADKESFMPAIIENCLQARQEKGLEAKANDVLALGGHLLMGTTPERREIYRQMFFEIFNYAYNAPPYHVPMGRVWNGSRQETLDNVMMLAERYQIDEFFLWHHVGYFGDDYEQESLIEFAEGVIQEVNKTV